MLKSFEQEGVGRGFLLVCDTCGQGMTGPSSVQLVLSLIRKGFHVIADRAVTCRCTRCLGHVVVSVGGR